MKKLDKCCNVSIDNFINNILPNSLQKQNRGMADQEIYTEKQMNKMKNKVIKCINEKDKEDLKKLSLRMHKNT